MSHHRFPYPDSYVIVNGYRMHYFHSGAEESCAVVLLHGNYSSGYSYRHLFSRLAQAGWGCFAPDCIGFGGSDKPAALSAHTFDFHSDNLEIFIRELGLRNLVLVGQEWGGLMALDYAINRADNTGALVLMNTAPVLRSPASKLRGLLHRSFLGDLLIRRLNLSLRDASLRGRVHYSENLDPQVKAEYRSPFPDYASRAGLLAFTRMAPRSGNDYVSLRMKAIRGSLPGLNAPTLLIGSGAGPASGRAEATLLQGLIPRSELQVLDDGGYLLQEDRPDLLSDWILSFLGRRARP